MQWSVGSPWPGVAFVFASLLVLARADASAPSLPRQFSVEIAPGGVSFADGTRLGALSELSRWAQRAASSARFSGAVVFGDPEREGAAVAEAIELLRKAGFADIRSAGRPAPAVLSAARTNGAAPVVSQSHVPAAAPVLSPPPAASRPRPAPSGPPVSLASMGMHVDGLLNREPHRGRFLRVIEHEFPAFKRCHGRATPHTDGASYGVDLLIPKEGGRAKVRETRTRLEGAGFQACMRSAFEAIRFPAPPSERPEIVSYSVVFKPGAR